MDVVKEEGKTDQVLLLLSPEGEGKKKKDLHICGGGGQIRCGGWARKKRSLPGGPSKTFSRCLT